MTLAHRYIVPVFSEAFERLRHDPKKKGQTLTVNLPYKCQMGKVKTVSSLSGELFSWELVDAYQRVPFPRVHWLPHLNRSYWGTFQNAGL